MNTDPPARIIVGLSGGVDSSVAALLLQQSGHSVEALHMRNWEDDDAYCSAAEDLQDAREVCRILGIALHEANFATEYRDRVFAQFLAEYESGRTPNPDVLCNREIKFGVFSEYAGRLGATRIATGHYARVKHDGESSRLLLAADADKDQTYFLHAVDQGALQNAVFPLGGLEKSEVRAIAARHGLPTRDKKDSTGICFIGERPFREFLSRYLPAREGPILTTDGNEIGRHRGAMYYTIGQRKGLGIGGLAHAGDAPWYVAERDVKNNRLIVVQGENHPRLTATALTASQATWIAGEPPSALASTASPGLRCHARIRHRQLLQPCRVCRLEGGSLQVCFDDPQWAIAAGQYVVFYADDECIGGAVIDAGTQHGHTL